MYILGATNKHMVYPSLLVYGEIVENIGADLASQDVRQLL
jgi:hypothetical protein